MIQRRAFMGGMAAILAGAAAPAYIKHAMPVKMVGSIATLDREIIGRNYAANLTASMRYIKHVGIGSPFSGAFLSTSNPLVPIGVIHAFVGDKLPVGWEYIDAPV